MGAVWVVGSWGQSVRIPSCRLALCTWERSSGAALIMPDRSPMCGPGTGAGDAAETLGASACTSFPGQVATS